MVNINSDSELPVTVVEPGGADDPFTANPASSSAPSASPAVVAGQETPAVAVTEVTQPQTVQVPNTPVVRPQAPAPATPPVVIDEAEINRRANEIAMARIAEATKQAELAAERAQKAQSAADKRAAELEQREREAQEARRQAERTAKLNADDLTEEEKALLQRQWSLEDREAANALREQELDAYHRELYAVALADEAAQFGVTLADLEALDSPEAMDAYAAQAELNFLRSGGVVQPATPVIASSAPVATPQVAAVAGVPAGVSAPSDLVEAPPTPQPKQMRTDNGPDALRENLRDMEWETLRMPV